jgi:hypothetical protein
MWPDNSTITFERNGFHSEKKDKFATVVGWYTIANSLVREKKKKKKAQSSKAHYFNVTQDRVFFNYKFVLASAARLPVPGCPSPRKPHLLMVFNERSRHCIRYLQPPVSPSKLAREGEENYQRQLIEEEEQEIQRKEKEVRRTVIFLSNASLSTNQMQREEEDGEYLLSTQESVSNTSEQTSSQTSTATDDSHDGEEDSEEDNKTVIEQPLADVRKRKRDDSDTDSDDNVTLRAGAQRRPKTFPSWLKLSIIPGIQQLHEKRMERSFTPAQARQEQRIFVTKYSIPQDDAKKLWRGLIDFERNLDLDWEDKKAILRQLQDDWTEL